MGKLSPQNVQEIREMYLKGTATDPKRPRLILTHEAGIADHVCGKDGGQPPFHTLSPSIRRLATKHGRIYADEHSPE